MSGMVTLAIGGGLAGFSIIQARNSTKSGTGIQKWVAEPSAGTAGLVAATQLAKSMAKVVIKGRYHRSVVAVTADGFAATLLAAFAFGSLNEPRAVKSAENRAALVADNSGRTRGNRVRNRR